MRKLVVLFIVLFSFNFVYSQVEFPRGAFLFGNTSVDFAQMQDELLLNYLQGSAGTGAYIPPIATNRNNAGLKVLAIRDLLWEHATAQRLIIRAIRNEAQQGEVLTWAYWYSKLTGDDNDNARRCLLGTHSAGYMVMDNVPEHEYNYDRTSYSATFRMKILRPLQGNPTVADLIIYCKTHGNELARVTKYYNDFTHDDYHTFNVPFWLDTDPPSMQPKMLTGGDLSLITTAVLCSLIDVRVYWHGNVTTWLDQVIVQDAEASALFAGSYNTAIDNEASPFISSTSYPLVQRFYLKDEPHINNFLAYNYIDNRLKLLNPDGLAQGRGRAITANWFSDNKTLWFLQEAQPNEYLFDRYDEKTSEVFRNLGGLVLEVSSCFS